MFIMTCKNNQVIHGNNQIKCGNMENNTECEDNYAMQIWQAWAIKDGPLGQQIKWLEVQFKLLQWQIQPFNNSSISSLPDATKKIIAVYTFELSFSSSHTYQTKKNKSTFGWRPQSLINTK